VLKGVGKPGQEAWLRSRVRVSGEGPAAWMARRYLGAAGVGILPGSKLDPDLNTPAGAADLDLDLSAPEGANKLQEASRGVEEARRTLLSLLPGAMTAAEGSNPGEGESSGPSTLTSNLRDPLVVVVGAGGLGCPALLGLVWAGVRRLRIIDDDVVEISNLPRQILHGDSDLGKPKAISAAEELERVVAEIKADRLGHPASETPPSLQLDPRVERLEPGNSERLFSDADLVIEGSDNFPTKFRINAATRKLGIPAVIGGVIRFEGQTFTLDAGRGGSACYRCFFRQSPAPGAIPTCSSAGVLGPVAGAVALRQVALGLELLRGESSAGALSLYDGKSGIWTTLKGSPNPDCLACGPEADDPALRGAAEEWFNHSC